MKKDIDKLFSESLHTYYFLLIVIVIIKLLGSDWFDIVETNTSLVMINNFISTFKLEHLWYFVTLYINVFIVISITTNKNDKHMKIYSIFVTIVAMIFQILKSKINIPLLFVICDGVYMFAFSIIYLIMSKIKIKII